MRFLSKWLPKDSKTQVVYLEDFDRLQKSKKLLVRPLVLTNFFKFAVSNPTLEVNAILEGRLDGEFLLITAVHNCRRSRSTMSTVEMDVGELAEVSKTVESSNYVVGWAHSHPRFGVFLSRMDKRVQRDFQNLFPDSVALVLDPFIKDKITFKFFRVVNERTVELEYRYLVRRNETLKTD